MLRILVILSLLGQAYLSVITVQGKASVMFGHEASLSCSLPHASGVKQVTWQRVRAGDAVQTLATFSEQFKDNIDSQFVGKVTFDATLNSTSIRIKNTTFEDEACYICSFKAYPTLPKRETKCLTVKGISELRAVNPDSSSDSDVVVSCSATGKPTPTIQWKSDGHELNSFISTNFTTLNKDSSTTITSNLTLPLAQFHGKYVECLAESDGIKRTQPVVLKKLSGKDQENAFTLRNYIIPMLVLITISVLIISIFIHIKFRDKGNPKSACTV